MKKKNCEEVLIETKNKRFLWFKWEKKIYDKHHWLYDDKNIKRRICEKCGKKQLLFARTTYDGFTSESWRDSV